LQGIILVRKPYSVRPFMLDIGQKVEWRDSPTTTTTKRKE
jgi:hypothetical protein